MNAVTCHISISLDGFVAGPNQSLENPIGEGGMRLQQWAFRTASWNRQHGSEDKERNADSEVVDEVVQNVGAYIMGRKMFGGGDGPWDLGWRGWWGEDPPYHTPVFVLTHHPREPFPTIITIPPMYSASVNCQSMSTHSTRPSSHTKFVEANWNASAEAADAPFWNTLFAIAIAA